MQGLNAARVEIVLCQISCIAAFHGLTEVHDVLWCYVTGNLEFMIITFKQRKLQRVVNAARKLEAAYGSRMAQLIQKRLLVLEAADNLSQIPSGKPLRLHQLIDNRAGQFSVDLVHPYRLLFVPNHEPVPILCDGSIDRVHVTDITVIGILDTHK